MFEKPLMPADTVIGMPEGQGLRSIAARRACWGVAVALLALPASAGAAAGSPSDLSPRLAELAKPSVRSAPEPAQAAKLSLPPEGPGSLLREGNRVLVYVRFDHGAAAGLEELRAAGAKIVDASRRYQTVTVAARPADLHAVGAAARVVGVTEILAPIASSTECTGLVTSEGDSQLGASAARAAFGLDGGGVDVGILSDSFNQDVTAPTRAAQDIASGDLPGPGNPCGRTTPVSILQNLEEPEEAGDEGRAMAQIVHDLAPGASLSFASAFNGSFSFAENIRALHASGASVIADDVAYFEEPFFQDGPIAAAAGEVTAAGASYFSAAGNDNLFEEGTGNEIASWEAPEFRDSESCPASLLALPEFGEGHCMDFNPNPAEEDDTFGITVEEGETLLVDLQWAEPWFGVGTDLDAFLLNSKDEPLEAGGGLVASTEDNVGETQQPFEFLAWENPGPEQEVRLAIDRCALTCNPEASSSATPRLKFALLENGGGVSETEYPESSEGDIVGPTVFGHAGAAAAIGVGAVPSSDSSEPELYSSRGPVTHYFGTVDSSAPAGELKPAEQVPKPDLAATDCVRTTFFVPTKTPGVYRFCGTSAAAPHAAAVAALMRQANPSLSPAQLRAALSATASPVGAFGADAVGAGLVNAYGAVRSVALPPKIAFTEPPLPLSKNREPHIGFAANRPVTFSCSLDGHVPQPCSSPFVPSTPLLDGAHGFVVSGVDAAGRTGTSETISFAVDTKPPRTFLRHHPPRTIRTRHRRAKAVFRFGSNEAGVVFVCKVDGGLSRFCGRRYARRFRVGKHTLRVQARDAAGNLDRTPAVFRFKVKQVS